MMKRIWKDEEGQGMVEYALILALISIVAILALTSLGGKVKDKVTEVDDVLVAATVGG